LRPDADTLAAGAVRDGAGAPVVADRTLLRHGEDRQQVADQDDAGRCPAVFQREHRGSGGCLKLARTAYWSAAANTRSTPTRAGDQQRPELRVARGKPGMTIR
jgi:hypothetical protein